MSVVVTTVPVVRPETPRRDIKGFKIVHDDYNGSVFVSDGAAPPCDGCEHRERCKHNAIACLSFVRFVACEPGWEALDKVPNRDLYDLVFVEDDDDYLVANTQAAAARGDTQRLQAIAAELVIKDRLIELSYDYDVHRVAKRFGLPKNTESWSQRPNGAEALRQLEQARLAREEVDTTYTDEAIAERTGATAFYVKRQRLTHSQFPAETSRGGLKVVAQRLGYGPTDRSKLRKKA